jgi:16S rRNA C1402 N4-methylase RsmH
VRDVPGMWGKWSDLPGLPRRDRVKHQLCDVVLMDIGVSMKQVMDRNKGFDMDESRKLDMRFNMHSQQYYEGLFWSVKSQDSC